MAAPKASPTPAVETGSLPAAKEKEIVPEIDVLGLPPPTGILSAGTLEVLGADPSNAISRLGVELLDSRPHIVASATRVLDDILVGKPDMLSPLVDRFVSGVFSDNQRAAQTSANALPVVARNAPARVARQLNLLTSQFGRASDIGKDGLVRTFAALCAASVAYQKRLEEVIEEALGGADPKTLTRWMEIVLPALKGEPHARARAVIERRVHGLPKPFNQKIADYLRIKLRRPTP